MSGDMVPIIIVPTIFICFVVTIKILVDYGVKKRLIENDIVDDRVKNLYIDKQLGVPSSLKWGIVLIAVGSAILIGQLAPYSLREEVTLSGMFIMAGLALIAYYFLANRIASKSREEQ